MVRLENLVRGVALVAAKQLVAAIAGQQRRYAVLGSRRAQK